MVCAITQGDHNYQDQKAKGQGHEVTQRVSSKNAITVWSYRPKLVSTSNLVEIITVYGTKHLSHGLGEYVNPTRSRNTVRLTFGFCEDQQKLDTKISKTADIIVKNHSLKRFVRTQWQRQTTKTAKIKNVILLDTVYVVMCC